jgi:two-component system, OmpR family, response regulator
MIRNESVKGAPRPIFRSTVVAKAEAGALRILLVDDDAALGAMVSEYLAGEGFQTNIVTDGGAAVREALDGRYAAVILDIMLPRVSGIEILKRIRAISALPVIMLTARGNDVDRVIGLELGADDYLAKPFYMGELVARLRAVLRRAILPVVDRLSLGELTLCMAERWCTLSGARLELTATEFELLAALLRAGASVCTKGELSQSVLGRPHANYDRSVDVHISRLRQKLNSSLIAIETVRSVGYRLTRAPASGATP